MKNWKIIIVAIIVAISFCGCSLMPENNKVGSIEQEEQDYADLDKTSPIEDNNKPVSVKKDIYSPELIDVKEAEEGEVSEEKFIKFFKIKDVKDGDVTTFADGYENSNLIIKRVANTEGYVEYHFSDTQKELFSVKNEIENLNQNTEYIQFKDINGDGNDEILVSYFRRNTVMYLVNEFYVYGIVDDKWQQLMSYTYQDDERCISKLINSSEYKGKDIADVVMSEEGLHIFIEDGEKKDEVYYPKEYKLLVK